jgi:hypothetical protein
MIQIALINHLRKLIIQMKKIYILGEQSIYLLVTLMEILESGKYKREIVCFILKNKLKMNKKKLGIVIFGN